MFRTALAVAICPAAFVVACTQNESVWTDSLSGDGSAGSGGTDGTDGAGGTDGASGTGSVGTTEDSTGRGAEDTGDEDGGGGGPTRFDVGDGSGSGGEGGSPGEPTCANIGDYPDTSLGCEFWAASWHAQPMYGLGVGVGNSSQDTATVTFTIDTDFGKMDIGTVTVAPHSSLMVNVNGKRGGLNPGWPLSVGIVTDTYLNKAVRIVSDIPVNAMQIAPVGGAEARVADAALLLPVNTLAKSYMGVSHRNTFDEEKSLVAIVAIEDDTTVLADGGATATIDAYDVHVFAMEDATGYFVSADKPFAMFSGTDCSFFPQGVLACDHLAEQAMPLSAWGTQYVGARHPARISPQNSGPEPVHWRIVAGEDDTAVTLTPDVAGGGVVHLTKAGDYHDFTTEHSFVADGSRPFMLLQYMSSCRNVSNDDCRAAPGSGDPYMIQMPPTDQWLEELPFQTDTSYQRDFVVFARERGTVVELECLGEVDEAHFEPIPGTNFEVGHVDLDTPSGGEGSCADGAQYVRATGPVGVIVGGMDYAASYGYPAGLAIGELWTPPSEPTG